MGGCGQYAKVTCGVILVLMVDAIWVCASYIVQYIYSLEAAASRANATNTSGRDKATPYLLTTVANSLFIVYLPIAMISHYAAGARPMQNNDADETVVENSTRTDAEILAHSSTDDENVLLLCTADPTEEKLLTKDEPTDGSNCCACLHAGSARLTKRIVWRNAKWAFITCWFWFGANLSYNWSLQHTSVSSNTIISSSYVPSPLNPTLTLPHHQSHLTSPDPHSPSRESIRF